MPLGHYKRNQPSERFVEAMAQIGVPPCERQNSMCDSYTLCAEQGLACKAFRHWIRSGRNGAPGRTPSRALFESIYRSDDAPPLFERESQDHRRDALKREERRRNERNFIKSLHSKTQRGSTNGSL